MEKQYTKESIIKSGIFNKDLAQALLDEKNRTLEEARSAIENYTAKIIKE